MPQQHKKLTCIYKHKLNLTAKIINNYEQNSREKNSHHV